MGTPPASLPKISAAAKKKILRAARDGTPRRFAAVVAGVSERTLFRYLRAAKDQGEGGPGWQFWQQLQEAEAAAVADRLKRMSAAARKGAWKADAWFLERCFPDHFGAERDKIRELERKLDAVLAAIGGPTGEGVGHAPPAHPGGAAAGGDPPAAPGAVQPGLAPPVPAAPLPDPVRPAAPGAGG